MLLLNHRIKQNLKLKAEAYLNPSEALHGTVDRDFFAAPVPELEATRQGPKAATEPSGLRNETPSLVSHYFCSVACMRTADVPSYYCFKKELGRQKSLSHSLPPALTSVNQLHLLLELLRTPRVDQQTYALLCNLLKSRELLCDAREITIEE
ncbi:hypothetical protein EJ110_NYTH02631 [Nymphaea thermarum]|nr:hypothetical protein EJ110_NYTH02631 [Nymphaea thermarum]